MQFIMSVRMYVCQYELYIQFIDKITGKVTNIDIL